MGSFPLAPVAISAAAHIFKGIVDPNVKFRLITTHPQPDGGSCVALSNLHKPLSSFKEGKNSTQWETIVAEEQQQQQQKRDSTTPYRLCGVIKVSGRLGSPVLLKTAKLTPCFLAKYPL